MFTYFKYVELNLIKKKTTWVAAGVFWLYMSLILIIVPAILHLNPDILWTTTLFDIKSFTIIILAILCAIITVVIFRDPLEDGSELIIISKPISRVKLISVKIICYLLYSMIILLVSMLIMAFMYCFGRKTVTNTTGVDFAVIPKMEGGLFLGGMIIILLFGGIAIIVNGTFNKIGILIITIGIAVVLNIINTITPFVATTPNKYISRKYQNEMESSRYIDVNGQFHNSVYSRYNSSDENGDFYGTAYYANQGVKNTSGTLPSYINVGSQISQIFNAFTTNEKFDDTANAFGQDYTFKYSLRADDNNKIVPILKDDQDSKRFYPTSNTLLPNIVMQVQFDDYRPIVQYRVSGPSTDALSQYSLLGMKDDAVACYRPDTTNLLKNLGKVKFYSAKDIYNLPPTIRSEIDSEVGTLNYTPLTPDEPPTLIQQFDKYASSIYYKEWPLYFRSIIAADLLGENPGGINPKCHNNYFYNGDNLGIHIGVEKLKQPDVSQNVINQVNDAMNAAYIKLVSYINMSLEKLLWTEIAIQFNDQEFNDDAMVTILQNGDNIIWQYNNLIHIVSYDTLRTFDVSNKDEKNFNQSGYTAPTYEAVNGDKTNIQFHWFYHTVSGTSCLMDMYLYDAHRYYTPTSVTLFWSIFSVLLFAAAVVIYLKTDFK